MAWLHFCAALTVGTAGLSGVLIAGAVGGLSCGVFQTIIMAGDDFVNHKNTSWQDYGERCFWQALIGTSFDMLTGGIGNSIEKTECI